MNFNYFTELQRTHNNNAKCLFTSVRCRIIIGEQLALVTQSGPLPKVALRSKVKNYDCRSRKQRAILLES